MENLKIKDGFIGELQINVPREVIINHLRRQEFLNNLFITHIGYFPKAKFHYRERLYGCADNILLFCVGGKGFYQTDTVSRELKMNEFIILPAGKYHMYQADLKDPWSIYWIHFSGHMVKSFNSWIHTERFVTPQKATNTNKIIEQWAELYYALNSGLTEENMAYANLCLYRFLSFFIFPHDINPSIQKENPIAESIAYMKSNIDKQLTIEELAGQLNFSTSHYSAVFKKVTSKSPIEYFINLKMHYACQLLSQTELRVSEVSDKLGYEDSFYFSRLFRKSTGKSPLEYRKGIKK